MDLSAFAGLLAQVIPAVLIALVVELRSVHEIYQKLLRASSPQRGTKRKNLGGVEEIPLRFKKMLPGVLTVQYGVVGILALIEMAALVAARYRNPGLSAYLVEPAVAVGAVGGGFLLVMMLSALATNHLYRELGALSESQRRGLHWSMRIVIYLVTLGFAFVLIRTAS